MSWETRVFFDLDNDLVREELSLASPKIARAMFDEEVTFDDDDDDDDDERRVDGYVLFSNHCQVAEKVGLKVRSIDTSQDAYYRLLQLKTVRSVSDEAPHLVEWEKSSQYVHESIHEPTTIIKFLQARLWQTLAPQAMACLQQQLKPQHEVPRDDGIIRMVQVDKRRISTMWRDLDVEQVDVIFRFPNQAQTKYFRSWSVEGDEETTILRQMAHNWPGRFQKIAESITTNHRPPTLYLASYPTMIYHLAQNSISNITGTSIVQQTVTETPVPHQEEVQVQPYWGWYVLVALCLSLFLHFGRSNRFRHSWRTVEMTHVP